MLAASKPLLPSEQNEAQRLLARCRSLVTLQVPEFSIESINLCMLLKLLKVGQLHRKLILQDIILISLFISFFLLSFLFFSLLETIYLITSGYCISLLVDIASTIKSQFTCFGHVLQETWTWILLCRKRGRCPYGAVELPCTVENC